MGPSLVPPNSIVATSDEVTNGILKCEGSGKSYKIIPSELQLHRLMGVPLPRRCPEQRHLDRLSLRNPRTLWDRTCSECAAPIQTSYSPERPEKVLCEACYLKMVY